MRTRLTPGWLLPFLLLCGAVLPAATPSFPYYSRADARRYVLDDFCKRDCAGYLETHSRFYRRIYARALAGNSRALRKVLLDRRFHSGDNESWEPVPGNLLYVVGDVRFDRALSTMSASDQKNAMTYLQIAGFFHEAYLQGDKNFFARNFQNTNRRYVGIYPEYTND